MWANKKERTKAIIIEEMESAPNYYTSCAFPPVRAIRVIHVILLTGCTLSRLHIQFSLRILFDGNVSTSIFDRRTHTHGVWRDALWRSATYALRNCHSTTDLIILFPSTQFRWKFRKVVESVACQLKANQSLSTTFIFELLMGKWSFYSEIQTKS